eukprot:3796434-Amphidinium_carterae.1
MQGVTPGGAAVVTTLGALRQLKSLGLAPHCGKSLRILRPLAHQNALAWISRCLWFCRSMGNGSTFARNKHRSSKVANGLGTVANSGPAAEAMHLKVQLTSWVTIMRSDVQSSLLGATLCK